MMRGKNAESTARELRKVAYVGRWATAENGGLAETPVSAKMDDNYSCPVRDGGTVSPLTHVGLP